MPTPSLPRTATLHDKESRSFQVLESPGLRRIVHVTMAPPTERPLVAVRLPRQAFIGGMVQVDAVVRSARRAASREAFEVLTLRTSHSGDRKYRRYSDVWCHTVVIITHVRKGPPDIEQ